MVDYLAPKWGALLVFPEERYYGKSLPFGQDSWTTDHIKYLSVENILADIVELTAHLKSTLGADAANCPVSHWKSEGAYGYFAMFCSEPHSAPLATLPLRTTPVPPHLSYHILSRLITF